MKEMKSMTRIEQLEPEKVPAWTRKMFNDLEKGMGILPNMFKCMGNSDDALKGFMDFNRQRNCIIFKNV